MAAETIVATAQRGDRDLDRARKRRAPRPFDCWRLRCTGALGRVLGAFGVSALGLSCRGPLSDACDELGTCAPSGRVDASVEGSSDTSSCDPTKDPKDEPCVLDSAYGVFVASAGSDAGAESLGSGVAGPDGTAARPYASIGQALANMAGKSRVYVCNGVYAEHVSITAAVSVYGGLSCGAGFGVCAFRRGRAARLSDDRGHVVRRDRRNRPRDLKHRRLRRVFNGQAG